VTFWAYLRFYLLLWILRASWRALRWLVTAAVLIAAAPITLVAAVALAGAWLRGWLPARLWRPAAWTLPMTACTWRGGRCWPAPGALSRWPRCMTGNGLGA
jgi:hypothetical protein